MSAAGTRAIRFAATGLISGLSAEARRRLLARERVEAAPELAARVEAAPELAARVAAIIARVRSGGDEALRALGRELDGVELETLEVPRVRWEAARESLDPAVREALERAAANIRAVHSAFAPVAQHFVTADGVEVGRRPDPFAAVGVYAPGGRAAYPSSLLMGAVPARVAGVGEVIVCTPPTRDGVPSDVILATAAIAGVDRLFAVGGAGAIAAMALGTATIPRVDRIVGPGNAYVAAAKMQLSGVVGIDAPAGPSELLVLADDGASPEVVAREMLAQAEHDPDAAVLLVALSPELAGAVGESLGTLIDAEPRAAVIRAAFAARGALLVARDLEEAIAFASEFAAEHLLLCVPAVAAARVSESVRSTGTILLGETSSVAFGDYLTGANHVLPTAGAARRWSGLSTDSFVRWTTWQRVPLAAARALVRDTVSLARAEGLPAHAAAVAQWEAGRWEVSRLETDP